MFNCIAFLDGVRYNNNVESYKSPNMAEKSLPGYRKQPDYDKRQKNTFCFSCCVRHLLSSGEDTMKDGGFLYYG